MPHNDRPPRPARASSTSTNSGTSKTAATELTQVTWVVGDRMYSREFNAADHDGVRATKLGLYGSGARNVSTETIAAGTTYTAYGER